MHIYLPIAEMSVNIFLILAMGGGVGFLSGLFGVGGGFLMRNSDARCAYTTASRRLFDANRFAPCIPVQATSPIAYK